MQRERRAQRCWQLVSGEPNKHESWHIVDAQLPRAKVKCVLNLQLALRQQIGAAHGEAVTATRRIWLQWKEVKQLLCAPGIQCAFAR